MKNIAIIPARSGSKGLVNKNIKLLNGVPLIAYTIKAALESECFDEVMVSTDSKEYMEIAKMYGANVPFLREEYLATDTSGTFEVVRNVLSKYMVLGEQFDTVTILQPTSPLRTSADIKNALCLYLKKHATGIVSICESNHSPLWMNTLPKNESLENFLGENSGVRRQELDKYYRINGAIYMFDVKKIINSLELYDKNTYAYIMPKQRSIDIDDNYDFLFAEALLRNIIL